MIVFLLIIAYSLATTVVLGLLWPYCQGSPVFWFPVTLWLMAVGTFLLVDLNLRSDVLYVALFFLALVIYTLSTFLFLGLANTRTALADYARRPEEVDGIEARGVTVILLLISAIISVIYYYLIGYNVFILLISGQIDSNYSELRLGTYSEGGNYFAPGYVNQFKNVLLPLTAAALAMWLRNSRFRSLFYLYAAVTVPLVMLALAGTGQRAYLVYTFVALIFGFVLHGIGRPSGLPFGRVIAASIPLFAIFGLMTGAYYVAPSEGASVTGTVFSRFTSIQQESGLAGFRYIYPLQIAWFSEWLQGLAGVLPRGIVPGERGSNLSHEIFAYMYGSTAGTAPISLVGSAYYNGGVLGVILLYGVIGGLFTAVYTRFLGGRRTILRSLSYGFMFFYLSIWVAEGLAVLVDNGVVTVALFLILIKIPIRRFVRVPRHAPAL